MHHYRIRALTASALTIAALAATATTAQAADPSCTDARRAATTRLTNASNELIFTTTDTQFRWNGATPALLECARFPTQNRTYIRIQFDGKNFWGLGNPEDVQVMVYVGGTNQFISCNGATYSMPLGTVTAQHDHASGYHHQYYIQTPCE